MAEFRYQIRLFLRFSEQAAREAGLEPTQHQLLLAVRAHDGAPTVGELAERLQLRHHSVVGLVDRLAEAGLVRRDRAAGDRRQVRVRLTRAGSVVLRKLSVAHRMELDTRGKALAEALGRIVNRKHGS